MISSHHGQPRHGVSLTVNMSHGRNEPSVSVNLEPLGVRVRCGLELVTHNGIITEVRILSRHLENGRTRIRHFQNTRLKLIPIKLG